jgi:ribosomal-protein-alanine N-acetyltransferase
VRYTERLRLEEIGPRHVDDLLRVHTDPDVALWYGGAWTREIAEERAKAWGEAWERDGAHKWIAYEKESGDLVGRGGVSRVEVERRPCIELGWALLSSHRGRGYATEIGRAGLDFAFDDLDASEVVAYTEPHNTRSRAVMERLGMTYVKEFTQNGERFVLYVCRRDELSPS